MKRLTILMVFVALGAATLSCEDTNYNEVEQTVLENQTSDPIEGHEDEENRPGSN